MRVWDAVAEILRREGVDSLCTFPSTPLIDAAATHGIRPVVCRQERVGLGIADGFARTTNGRRPSVFAMQSGPGSENAYPGLATAFADSTPVLVIPLGLPIPGNHMHPQFDSRAAFTPISKSYERISTPSATVDVLRRAFGALRSARGGPVVVEVPQDIGQQEIDGVDGYRPVPAARSAADPALVERAVAALVAARDPVIVAGQGVLYAEAWGELRLLAELLEVPVVTTLGGKSSFPEAHPLSLGTASMTMSDVALRALRDADLILAVGCSLTRGANLTAAFPPGKVVIHVTNDPRDLHKCYPTEHPLPGDARLVLAQVVEAAREHRRSRHRDREHVRGRIRAGKEAWMARWMPRLTSNQVPINAYRVVYELGRQLDPDRTVLTHDAGSPRDQVVPFYTASVPRSFLGWGKSHGLGAGLGFAIGARLAEPEKVCVHLMGDAAFGMTGLDLETSVRTRLPTLTLLLRNDTMAIEYSSLVESHRLYRTRDLGGEYGEIARALGLEVMEVRDPAAVGAALARARRQVEGGRSTLVEFHTSSEIDFSNYAALRC